MLNTCRTIFILICYYFKGLEGVNSNFKNKNKNVMILKKNHPQRIKVREKNDRFPSAFFDI